jgi:hypothetical protein
MSGDIEFIMSEENAHIQDEFFKLHEELDYEKKKNDESPFNSGQSTNHIDLKETICK